MENGAVRFLIDAGLGPRTLAARLAGIGRDLTDLTAVFLTHEHTDHIRGAGSLARKLRVPIYATAGTHSHLKRHLPVGADFRSLQAEDSVRLGNVTVESYPTPHDGDETVAFVVRCGGRKLGHATDLGTVDAVVRDKLRDCDALLVEANHDPAMLESGPYPYFLQQRIGGGLGHLSNAACGDLIAGVAHAGLQTVVLMHLSASNNHPDLAREHALRALGGRPVRLLVSR
ncbi:MAG: MBL fold metallo-hydrolase, partial [Nitrospinaceae bacterium]